MTWTDRVENLAIRIGRFFTYNPLICAAFAAILFASIQTDLEHKRWVGVVIDLIGGCAWMLYLYECGERAGAKR